MKIGRNDPCPCGSGKKYKRCCATKLRQVPKKGKLEKKEKVTLGGAIEKVQALAAQKKEMVIELGVFLLYVDVRGDAWVLEITDSDCVQIASAGEPLDVPLEESEETIVMEWAYTFKFVNKQLQITAYSDKAQSILEKAPSQKLYAAEKRILRRYSQELLDQVHIKK